MRNINLKIGDIVILRTMNKVIKDYGEPDEKGWVKVGSQTYSDEIYQKYKNNLYSVCRVEGDRVIFFNSRGLWQKITTGMVKRVYKCK